MRDMLLLATNVISRIAGFATAIRHFIGYERARRKGAETVEAFTSPRASAKYAFLLTP